MSSVHYFASYEDELRYMKKVLALSENEDDDIVGAQAVLKPMIDVVGSPALLFDGVF